MPASSGFVELECRHYQDRTCSSVQRRGQACHTRRVRSVADLINPSGPIPPRASFPQRSARVRTQPGCWSERAPAGTYPCPRAPSVSRRRARPRCVHDYHLLSVITPSRVIHRYLTVGEQRGAKRGRDRPLTNQPTARTSDLYPCRIPDERR